MKLPRFLHVLAVLWLAAVGLAGAANEPSFRTAVGQVGQNLPLMRIPQAETPIHLVAVRVQARVAGSLARTRLDLTFLNDNRRALEGEFQFPLAEGQSVTAFALESLDGHMLSAVAVNKQRGQEVFEAIERREADPALLEQTLGNNFKLRVYPLPAGKTRTVRLEITELLQTQKDGRVVYRWPLRFATGAPYHLVFEAELDGVQASQISLPPELRALHRVDRPGGSSLWLDQANFRSVPETGPSWLLGDRAIVLTGRDRGETYFHAEIPVADATAPRPRPKRLALIWDASGSGLQRDRATEFNLLARYFQSLDDVRVHLIVTRDRAEAPREFTIRAGDWSELRQTLASLAYDGASNPATWLPPQALDSDMTLLFSDGLGTWGQAPAGRATKPLFAVSSALAGNPNLLRTLAETSGGAYLNLSEQGLTEALAELQSQRPVFYTAHVSGIDDLALPSIHPRNGRLRVAGRLLREEGILNFSLRRPDGRFEHRQLRIRASAGPDSDWAAKLWASFRLTQLEAEPTLHRAEIERLAGRFGLVSSQTALLVLESLEDHLRYQIEPAAGPWREAYLARVGRQASDSTAARSRHLDALARRFAVTVRWWETAFPKGPLPIAPPQAGPAELARAAMDRAERHGRAREVRALPAGLPRATFMAPATAAAPVGPADADRDGGARIHLRAWQSDAGYARRLREASDAQRYTVYLDERPSHLDSTAFYLDAADVFFAKGQTELAVRILSNLAEMNLESRHILRVLAYRLNQAGETRLALPLLQRIRELAPDEPQSWRDLGLALALDGQAQAALEALWETASRPWDARFADIDLIALAELNALAARSPGLDTRAVDSRLLRNLPLDLRVVLAWDSDNTDMDLWVIDPNGEKTHYAHPLSHQGGRLSRDFTAGYGPEVFDLKSAKPGRYEVRVQFYGHRQQVLSPYTTVMLRFSSDFGRPGQKDENIILRLAEAKDDVLVGSFEVADKP